MPAPPRVELDRRTAVAGAPVSCGDGNDAMGVAPDTEVHLAHIPLGIGRYSDSRLDPNSLDDSPDMRWNCRPVQEAASQGASGINYGFGYDGIISPCGVDEVRSAFRDLVGEPRHASTHHANRKIPMKNSAAVPNLRRIYADFAGDVRRL